MKSERKRQILEVSQRLFLHFGFNKVTLGDIAKELGVSRPTVYQAFPNKEEIFKALIEIRHDEWLERIRAIRKNGESVRDQLTQAIEIWIVEPFLMLNSTPGENDFQNGTFDFADEIMEGGYVAFESEIASIITGEVTGRPLPDKELAHLIARSVRGYKSQATGENELRRLISGLLDLAFNGG